MPERDKVVDGMMRRRYGEQVFNGLTGECRTMSDYRDREAEMDVEFEAIVRNIDWNRVLLTAWGRHAALKHEGWSESEAVCGECVREALLTTTTFVSWTEEGNEKYASHRTREEEISAD